MSFPNFNFWSHLLETIGLEVCGVAALGFVAQLFFRSAVWQRTIWQMTVICLLLLPASEWTGFGRGTAGFLFGHKQVVENIPTSDFKVFKPGVATAPVTAKLQLSPAMPHPAVWWPAWVWLAGAAIVLVRMAAAQVLLLALRLRREKITSQSLQDRVAFVAKSVGLRRKVSLLRMPKSMSPMAFGIFRPSIGLPPGFETKLSATEQEAVLAHELAHLAAMDPLWFLLADFASAWLWWHPLAWWVRLSLHGAAELAADEATALLPDGPGALANCLVSLGKEMTASRGWSWVGINGGFRSKLGKRVERLVRMSGVKKRPLAGWAGAAAKLAVTILVVPIVVLLFGSFQSAQGQKKDSLRDQLRETWSSSPGAMLMLAALDDVQKPKVDIATRVQNGKLLYEMGKLDKSEAVLVGVVKEDPANRAAAYYLDLIKEAGYMERARKHQLLPPPPAMTIANQAVDGSDNKVQMLPLPRFRIYADHLWTGDFQVEQLPATSGGWHEAPVNKSTNNIEQGNDKNQDIASRVTKGKLLYERGKLDESEAVLMAVIKDDPANRSAPYYLDLIKEARFTGHAPKLQDGSGTIIITKGRQYILSKLHSITLDEVSYDVPLKDVLARLHDESQKRDPDGIGVNFMIDQNVGGTTPFSTNTNGAISPRKTSQQKDIGTDVRIKISPSMHNVRLADVLDAITKAADSPVRYMVQDYAVVFSPGPSETDPSVVLHTKTFRVNSKVFVHGLENVTGVTLNLDTSQVGFDQQLQIGFGGRDYDSSFVVRTNGIMSVLASYLASRGVTLSPPQCIFFNDGLGLLLVRATQENLEIIQQAIEVLNQTPPQVMIEARFVEMDEAALQGPGLNWKIIGIKTAPGFRVKLATNSQGFTGTMTDPQLRLTLNAIEQHFHADVLGAPKVTTESGRHAHIGSLNAGGAGVTLDVIPTVEPDGYFIQVTATPAIETGKEPWGLTVIRKVLDGETLVIGSEITNQSPGPKKVRVVFVTPRIMDPAGNPVHTDEEISKRSDRPGQ